MSRKTWTGSDATAEFMVAESRARLSRPLGGRERVARWAGALTFLAVAVPLALLLESQRSPSLAVVVVLLGLYAIASRLDFEIASGSAVPTALVFVPMLFVLPAGAVPLAVAVAAVLGQLPDCLRGRLHAERLTVSFASSWFAVPPALVLLAAGEPQAQLQAWPWLAAALAAQFAGDLISTAISERAANAVPARELLAPMAWVFLFDALLSSAGFAVAVAAQQSPAVAAFVLPLLGLIVFFARERQARIDNTLELSSAYRGTAFLLGDVVEADDAYTGSHSHDVVELVLAVCDRLGVDATFRRRAELAALLHDVGKIRIPNSIINKPGPLTDEERAIINTHTIEGEVLLERVGGLLAEVGSVVRSCHEHYDGSGYPDRLAGEEIPLAARIVSCCDAFNAMTTDRPYRSALSLEDACAELRRVAGTQFDPTVVVALLDVVRERELAPSSRPTLVQPELRIANA